MTKPQKDRVIKWIAALRSGEYKQGKGALRLTEDTYCCLGVGCDISKLDQWSEADGEYVYDESSALLPLGVAELYGLKSDDGAHYFEGNRCELSMMNDHGDTFPEISDRIEYCLNHPETEMFV